MRLFLYISTERRNPTFAAEIRKGIEAIHAAALSEQILGSISLRSISVKHDLENEENCAAEVVEYAHNLQSDDEEIQKLQSYSLSDASNAEADEFYANDFFKLSESLYAFADFCSEQAGIVTLCIIWCVEKYAPCPSEVVEFYAALLRLQSWHNGSLNIITTSNEAVDDWKNILPFYVCPCSTQVIGHNIGAYWRGSLAFSVQGNNGPVLYPEVTLSAVCDSFNPFEPREKREAQFVLPVCEVFSEVELSSIPWSYIQKESLCKLQPALSVSKEQRSNIINIFKAITSQKGTGTLIRIRHSSLPPALEGLESAGTKEWKQIMAEGNFDAVPSYRFQGYHHCCVLVVLPDCSLKDTVYCVALQDYSVHGEDVVKLVTQESLCESRDLDSDGRKKVLSLLRETGEVSYIKMAAFSCLLLNLPFMIKKQLAKKGQNLENLWDETKAAIERSASKQIENLLFSNLPPVKVFAPNQFLAAEISVQKEYWSEFQALEEVERLTKKLISRSTSGELLCGLLPPKSADAVLIIDASQLSRYFKSNGEPVEQLPMSCSERVPAQCSIIKSSLSLDEIKKRSWSESFHTRHHGIYYNAGAEQEKFEFACNRYRDRHINIETTATCTLFQDKENITLMHSQKTKSSLKVTNDNSSAAIWKHSKLVSDIDAASVKSGSNFGSSSRRRSPPRKVNDRILRRSPRKRKRDEEKFAKPSDFLKPETVATQNRKAVDRRIPKPAELSDNHKRKLRNAVLTTLEGEGVNMNDRLFKLCFKKLFAVCRPFVLDVIGQGSTTRNFEKIASSHVKQVVQFERQKNKRR